ncbi:DUF2815 family protein [Sporolactobacillus sp. CQH2019]|uniref:DUF2815 family protein n=1 Tax=Sporolactobacillus sp. CQH2019 TaxID=3023512 RepID=UPI002368667D|nr:DUF2815 family protein [Sporolactobacillus sp. CQH2019]MDD9148135.1 DUF2815 family protein [Sporolactobacillus sp. CQH2019]
MATRNTDTKVVTGKVRFSYLHCFEAVAIQDGQDPKYSVSLLIPKSDTTTLRKIKAATDAAKKAGASKWGGKIPANLKTPLRDGDAERPDQEEYKGCYFLNASSKTKPGVVDQHLNAIIDSDDLYSGCYGRASLNFYAYNAAGNKGIAAGLNNLQKMEDGDYLGGRSKAEDDFDAIDTGDVQQETEDFLG